jgi:maltooligosyltrehalose trehalohydrolase
MKFSIWAPKASTVDLCLADGRRHMTRAGRDTWEATVTDPAPEGGLRYRYSINGGTPLPDPFSRWQPEGVHGDSWAGAVPAAREERPRFRPVGLSSAVIYEMHIGTFTPDGTYIAAREKLPLLSELGVTHVEVMPLATFPGRHGWGYDGTYLFAPHPAYGTPAELMQFIDACHDHGMGVLLDVVYNHLGPDGNYLPAYGPCFAATGKTLWGERLNFDEAGSDGMRQLVLENATMWLRDYGFDGLRLDAVHAIGDTRALPILEELSLHIRELGKKLGRDFILIAESERNDPRLVRPPSAGGGGFDAMWADDFHHAVHRYLTGEHEGYYADFEGLAHIARALREGYVYQGQYAPSRQRGHGRPPDGISPAQLVLCTQNHDQVGNRARGERLSQLLPVLQLKAAAALLLLAPNVPLLFQGEEWGASSPFQYFTDHSDPELARAVSAGRQREFPTTDSVPDPQDPTTFRNSQLRWNERSQVPYANILAWYQCLIGLRQGLRSAPCAVEFNEDAQWLTLQRGNLLAVFNFSGGPQRIPFPTGDWRLTLASLDARPMNCESIPPLATVIFSAPAHTTSG